MFEYGDYIHDNTVKSYCVDFENNLITIITDNSNYDKPDENVKLLFIDAIGHFFEKEHDMGQNILFDIHEYTFDEYVKDIGINHLIENIVSGKLGIYETELYCDQEKELIEYFKNNNFKYYSINGCVGMYGWIVAKDFKVIVDEKIIDIIKETCVI